jgi:protein TonB
MQGAERFLPSSILACAMTFALFWLMQALVVVEDRSLDFTPRTTVVPFVIVHQPPRPLKTRTTKPERSKQNEKPPTPAVEPRPIEGDAVPGLIPIDPVDPSESSRRGRGLAGPGEFDRNAVALVRIAPDYPVRALRRGIEGRVLLEFTIGRTGAVENAKVIAAEPNSIFNDAALKAVRQWRYEPKIENGEAVEQPGIQISIPFRREDQ